MIKEQKGKNLNCDQQILDEFNGGEHERWLDMSPSEILFVVSCLADTYSVSLRLFANVIQPLYHSNTMALVTHIPVWTYKIMTAYLCPL